MKEKVLETFYALINYYFQLINHNKSRILIYTDSRGTDVAHKNRKNLFNSYIGGLVKRYHTTYFICKEKHTTIIDFLATVQNYNLDNFDYVVLHCGVVDFSPRPISNLNFVLNSKGGHEYFKAAQKKYDNYYSNPSAILYKNEPTQNIYPPEYLQEVILPALKEIRNLIWISSNHFVADWTGNYTAGRPQNIDEYVYRFDTILMQHLPNVIDLYKWSDEEIKKYTIDNIHFNKAGFSEILRLINQKLNREA